MVAQTLSSDCQPGSQPARFACEECRQLGPVVVVEVVVAVSLPEVTGTGLACKHSSQGCGGLRPEEVRVYIRFISQ